MACLAPHLDPGERSVGTRIELAHMAATPIGMTVYIEATLTGIDRRRLTFDIHARDDNEEIGAGRHERFLINLEQFLARAGAKRGLSR